MCAIEPIRLLALPSYRSLTIQILIFAILDLNFSLNLDNMQATSSPSLLYYYVCASAILINRAREMGAASQHADRKISLAGYISKVIIG